MNKFDYRIPYADTDKMGVVYHSNYLKYFRYIMIHEQKNGNKKYFYHNIKYVY